MILLKIEQIALGLGKRKRVNESSDAASGLLVATGRRLAGSSIYGTGEIDADLVPYAFECGQLQGHAQNTVHHLGNRWLACAAIGSATGACAASAIGGTKATGTVEGFCGSLLGSCVCVATGLETGGLVTGGIGGDTVCVTGAVGTIGTPGIVGVACVGGLGVSGFCTTAAGGVGVTIATVVSGGL